MKKKRKEKKHNNQRHRKAQTSNSAPKIQFVKMKNETRVNLGFHFEENTNSQILVQEGAHEPESVFLCGHEHKFLNQHLCVCVFCAFAD